MPAPHVEFGHAINYVTTIKKRFASSPEIYRKFLEILHTYQKEQRGIKEVLDEVSTLFADHADLLKEFTYFLPDAVQGVAKKQLDRAAEMAEERMRAKAKSGQTGAGLKLPAASGVQAVKQEEPRVPAAHVKKVPFGATQGRSENEENEIKKSVGYGVVNFDPVRPPRRNEPTPAQSSHLHGRPTHIPPLPISPTTSEYEIFEKIKLHFEKKDAESKTPKKSYQEFIKCLHLFGVGILNRDELLQLLRGLFGKSVTSGGLKPNAILVQLENVMMQRGPWVVPKVKKPLSSYEETTKISPSYYTYPSEYVIDSCSGMIKGDKKVLNNKVFCRGRKEERMVSLEDYDGVRWRRNVHEGVLNRVEDEMYEVDIAIERNAQTLKLLAPIVEEMTKLKSSEEKAGQPIGRLQYSLKPRSLNSIHIGAIARIYGDSGDEVVQHLIRNPLMVVPIVYKRMQEKDGEWRKAKGALVKEWKKEVGRHWEGSLDVKGYFYRVELEKNLEDESLIGECQGTIAPTQVDIPNLEYVKFCKDPNPEMSLFQPHLSIKLPIITLVFEDLHKLLLLHSASKDAVDRAWNNMIAFSFVLPTREDAGTATSYNPGQHVKTTMGDGQILSCQRGVIDSSVKRYLVKFPFAEGYVLPSAILQALPSGDTSMPSDPPSPPLIQKMQMLFGTEKMYVFLRVFICLVTVLSQLRDGVGASEYANLMKLALEKNSDSTLFEAECRKKAGPSVYHIFLNIPFLAKRCASALMRVVEEDNFMQLSHLSQLQLKDFNLLRSLSLKATEGAVYRIQRLGDIMSFNYLPPGDELQLTDSTPTSMEVEETAIDTTEPESKRQKTEGEAA